MNNNEILSGLIGLVMPYLVETIKAIFPNTKGRWLGYILSYGLCILVGAGTSYFTGKFDTQNVLSSMGSALIISQGFYNLYFKGSKIEKKTKKFRGN